METPVIVNNNKTSLFLSFAFGQDPEEVVSCNNLILFLEYVCGIGMLFFKTLDLHGY